MGARILCVDDEPNILQAFQRQLRRFNIVTAPGGDAALRIIDEEPPFPVVVSDFRMPGMNGVQFLAKVKDASPDTVRMMLTGQADMSDASEAVNEANVFRFLLKPCGADRLGKAFEAALEQHRLITAEKDLLEQTLKGAVEVLSAVLSMVKPEAFGRANRMREYVRHMSAELKLADRWQYEIAAMLSQIGCIAIPQEILDNVHAGQPLTDEEQKIYGAHHQVGHDLLARIPRLDKVAEMVRRQRFASNGLTPDRASEPVDVGAEMLRIAADFDDAVGMGADYDSAALQLRGRRQYSPVLISALETLAEGTGETEIRSIRVADLQAGMRVASDVRSKTGLLLLGSGQKITVSVLARLKSFSVSPAGVLEPLAVVARKPAEPGVRMP